MSELITQEQLKALMAYDPISGLFTWSFKNNRTKRATVGSTTVYGYQRTKLFGRNYLLHRLAWLYTYGNWPDGEIDHINRDRSDNRLCNLRECGPQKNQQNVGLRANNRTGFAGVSKDSRSGRFVAQIRIDGKNVRLGIFDTAEKASSAYQDARSKFHEFANEYCGGARYEVTPAGKAALRGGE